jgi:hypothetical protein
MKTTKTTSTPTTSTTSIIKVPRSHVDIVIDKLHPSIHTSLFGSSSSSSNTSNSNNNSIDDDDCNYDPNRRRRACLVAHANEALRLLQAKRAHFGVKDKPLVRAALVIDYLCRNATTHNNTTNALDTSNVCNYHRTTIPTAMLASVAGFTSSKKDKQILEVMQTVLAEHLDDSSIGIRLGTTKRDSRKQQQNDNNDYDNSRNCDIGNSSRKRDATSLLVNSSSRQSQSKTTTTTTMTTNTNTTTRTKTSILKPTNLIQELCITLGPCIPDAEYAAVYAMDIFHFLAYSDYPPTSATTNTLFTTYELRRDMERHIRYYEAACFYLAVKKSEGGGNGTSYTLRTTTAASSSKKKSKAVGGSNCLKKTTRKKKENEAWNDSGSSSLMQGSQQQEEKDGDVDNDNDDERYLTEVDVIRETNLLEGTFMTILACIRNRIDGISIPSSSSFGITRKRGAVDDVSVGGSSTKSGGSTLFEVTGETTKTRNSSSSSNVIALTTTNKVDDSLDNAFEQWKRGVLLEAKTAYYNMTMTNEVERQQAAADDNTCWLAHAADNVLRNYGFHL